MFVAGEAVFSSEQDPESLVRRIRALADKRQKEAAKERRAVAQGLLGAAHGYRALADALERQPSLPWLRPADQTIQPSPEGGDADDHTGKR